MAEYDDNTTVKIENPFETDYGPMRGLAGENAFYCEGNVGHCWSPFPAGSDNTTVTSSPEHLLRKEEFSSDLDGDSSSISRVGFVPRTRINCSSDIPMESDRMVMGHCQSGSSTPDDVGTENPTDKMLQNVQLIQEDMTNGGDTRPQKRRGRKARKFNFSETETLLLLKSIQLEKEVIEPKGFRFPTNKEKREVWERTMNIVNKQCGKGRTINELKKRFVSLKKLVRHEQRHFGETGTWADDAPSIYTKLILDIIGLPIADEKEEDAVNTVNSENTNCDQPSAGFSRVDDNAPLPTDEPVTVRSVENAVQERQLLGNIPGPPPLVRADALSKELRPSISTTQPPQPQPNTIPQAWMQQRPTFNPNHNFFHLYPTHIAPKTSKQPISAQQLPPLQSPACMSTTEQTPPLSSTGSFSSTHAPQKHIVNSTSSTFTQLPQKPIVNSSTSPQAPQNPIVISSTSSQPPHKPIVNSSTSPQPPQTPIVISSTSPQPPQTPIVISSTSPQPPQTPIVISSSSTSTQQSSCHQREPFYQQNHSRRNSTSDAKRFGVGVGARPRAATLRKASKQKSSDDLLFKAWLRSEIAKNLSVVKANASLVEYHDCKIELIKFKMGLSASSSNSP